MSLLAPRAFRFSARPLQHAPPSSIRPFSKTHRLSAFSESDHSMHDGEKAKIIEEHKIDALAKQKAGAAHWKRELASSSESAIKADREEITSIEDDIAKLQKETGEAAQRDHEHGKK